MKVIIMTDERCGGTTFTEILATSSKSSSFSGLHDPQTNTVSRFPDYPGPQGDIISLLDYLFEVKRINIIKLCYVSFSLAEYFAIVDYAVKHQVSLIMLDRTNIYDRALSKVVAEVTTYDIKTDEYMRPFSVDTAFFEYETYRYYDTVRELRAHLKRHDVRYLYVEFEKMYNKNADISMAEYHRVFDYLAIPESDRNIEEFKRFYDLDYQSERLHTHIHNMDQVRNLICDIQRRTES